MTAYDTLTALNSVDPTLFTTGTHNGVAVDTAALGGCDSVAVVLLCGVITDGSHAVTVEESATGTGSWTAVAAGNIQGSLPTIVAADDSTQKQFGVKTNLRYMRVVVTSSGTTTGGLIGAAIIVTGNRQNPAH